jgi:hypothetical protein
MRIPSLRTRWLFSSSLTSLVCAALLLCSFSIAKQNPPAQGDAVRVWRLIKRDLVAKDGREYWGQNIKHSLIPGGAEGVGRFRGVVISSTPREHPNVIVLGILDKNVPEVEMRFIDSRCVSILLFALLASTLIFGQSLDELKGKYGATVSETFTVRTGVGVRVRNGPNGRIARDAHFPDARR